MAPSLQLTLVMAAILLSFYFPKATAEIGGAPPPSVVDIVTTPISGITPVPSSHDIHDSFSQITLFEPILSNLGFQELAMAVPSLSDNSAFTTWNGPSTLFAPTDASIRSCSSCSVIRLLREHIVPGLFSHDYLRKLAFGTKIETMDPGRCITVTASTDANNNTKIFIGGVEITRPDLFNNGLIVVHGLQGYVAPLSPFSCNVEKMTSLSFPFQPDHRLAHMTVQYPTYMMRLMLRDAMLRLRNSGFSVLALGMKLKFPELVTMQNMTIFAVDDVSIFSGSYSYVNNIRFHIVPNMLLPIADLEKIASGTLLPTLERSQSLMVTTVGGFTPMRINNVRIKVPDIMRNMKIVAHSVYLPFPHLNPTANPYEGGVMSMTNVTGAARSCAVTDQAGGDCGGNSMDSTNEVKPLVKMVDHHGL